MDVSDWKELLKKSIMFSRLTEAEIARLLDASEEKSFIKGDFILREGDSSEHVFIIGSGVVTIALSGAGNNKVPIDTLYAGNFFGEMACIEHKPRMASVIAERDCELLKISSAIFHDLVEGNVRFASKFSLILSERLRKLTEEILAVRVKNVDEKLELSNTKLDASLKAMESQMKAAETIFEQTSSRASEVIQSFDRTRTQVILAGSVVSLIASSMLGLLAFFGWKEWKNITTPIQQKVEQIHITSSEIDRLHEKIQSQSEDADKISKLLVDLEDLKSTVDNAKNAQRTLYSIILKADFESIVLDQRDDLYGEMLNAADSNLTEELFMQFPKGLMKSNPVYRQPYMSLIRTGLNKHYVRTPKQEALSYYYLIAGDLLADNERGYVATRKKFDRFIDRTDSSISIIQDIGPRWFEEYLNAISDDRENTLKISRLNEVWDKITRPR